MAKMGPPKRQMWRLCALGIFSFQEIRDYCRRRRFPRHRALCLEALCLEALCLEALRLASRVVLGSVALGDRFLEALFLEALRLARSSWRPVLEKRCAWRPVLESVVLGDQFLKTMNLRAGSWHLLCRSPILFRRKPNSERRTTHSGHERTTFI